MKILLVEGLVRLISGLFFVVLLMCSSFFVSALTLSVQGVNGALLQNINARLSSIAPSDVANNLMFRHYVRNEILKATQALGYYQPTIKFSLVDKGGNQKQLVVTVNEGAPVKVMGVHVLLTGEGASDPELNKLIKAEEPKIGDVLNQGKFDSLKNDLYDLAIARGYFENHFTQHKLLVSVARHAAVWDIVFDTGPRYRFGKIYYENSNIQTSYLNNLAAFQTGDFYQSSILSAFNNALSSTNWFSSVLVEPEISQVNSDYELPILVQLQPQAKNLVNLGLGYSTDIGLNTTINWKKPWVNSKGESWSALTDVSAKAQQLGFSYKIPLKASPLTQYYVIQSGYKRENTNDTRFQSYSLDFSRYWQFSNGWQQIASIKTSYSDFTQAEQHNRTTLIYPSLSFSKTVQSGGLMPISASSQNYSLMIASRAWLSDINFVIFNARNTWITTLGKKNRFILRTQLGWLVTNNFSKVPPSLRFFAGGDKSIRGYGYKSISPKDSDGKLIGASRLATLSLEYQYNIAGAWWGAAFVDTGEAVRSFKHNDFKTGVGVGIRWDSIVGPIKFDIARPLGHQTPDKFYFYFGIGTEL